MCLGQQSMHSMPSRLNPTCPGHLPLAGAVSIQGVDGRRLHSLPLLGSLHPRPWGWGGGRLCLPVGHPCPCRESLSRRCVVRSHHLHATLVDSTTAYKFCVRYHCHVCCLVTMKATRPIRKARNAWPLGQDDPQEPPAPGWEVAQHAPTRRHCRP